MPTIGNMVSLILWFFSSSQASLLARSSFISCFFKAYPIVFSSSSCTIPPFPYILCLILAVICFVNPSKCISTPQKTFFTLNKSTSNALLALSLPISQSMVTQVIVFSQNLAIQISLRLTLYFSVLTSLTMRTVVLSASTEANLIPNLPIISLYSCSLGSLLKPVIETMCCIKLNETPHSLCICLSGIQTSISEKASTRMHQPSLSLIIITNVRLQDLRVLLVQCGQVPWAGARPLLPRVLVLQERV